LLSPATRLAVSWLTAPWNVVSAAMRAAVSVFNAVWTLFRVFWRLVLAVSRLFTEV